MLITIGLTLPRDSATVSVARHICRQALREIGVHEDCTADIELALTEAVTNVLEHSQVDDEYKVEVEIDDEDCCLRIIDRGHGFEFTAPPDPSTVDLTAEGGRGLGLMRALVDRLHFVVRDDVGTVVELHKVLAYSDTTLVKKA